MGYAHTIVITAEDRLHLTEAWRSLRRNSDLLWIWTLREVQIRYKQSVLGAAWAILQPLALMLIFTAVFSWLVRLPSDGIPYPLFSYTALVPWTFFASSLSFAIPALTNNMALVGKIYFPREILPLASIGAALVDFAIASLLFIAMLLWYGTPVHGTIIWVPLIILLQVILTIGVVLPLSALIVFFRDVRFIIPLLVQVWLYATPVIYPLTMVPEQWRLVYALNPMVGLIDAYRRTIIIGESPELVTLTISALGSVLLMLAGYVFFKHAEDTFADVI